MPSNAAELLTGPTLLEAPGGAGAGAELLVFGTGGTVFQIVSAALIQPLSAVSGSYSSLTSTQQATTTFGQDVNAMGDLDPRLGLLAGQQNLTQAVLHRLSTKRGLFVYAPNDGYDVRQLLNDGASTANGVGLSQMQQQIETEVEKDERVQSASALVTLDPVAQALTINLSVNTENGATLVLVIGVNGLTLSLLQGN